MELMKTFFERAGGARRDNPGFNQSHASVTLFDRAISRRSQRRIDAKDAQHGPRAECERYGGGVPLTVTVTRDPGVSGSPALGLVPMTLPSAPTVVVHSHFPGA
jgi:hypothetical protein